MSAAKTRKLRLQLIRVLIVLVLLCLASISHAAAFVVDTESDSGDASIGDGMCADAEGDCLFWVVIQEANATVALDSVTFADDVTAIQLFDELPVISGPLSIQGRVSATTSKLGWKPGIVIDASFTRGEAIRLEGSALGPPPLLHGRRLALRMVLVQGDGDAL